MLPEITDGVFDYAAVDLGLLRTYTVRDFDRDTGEVSIDFVPHARGVATTWARAATPGHVVGLNTPTGMYDPLTTSHGRFWWRTVPGLVATVIARLAEAGRLLLDDPVSAHVPELRGNRWAQAATLRDLLANRSGLALRAGLEFDFAGRGDEDDGALSRLAADAAPGVRAAQFWFVHERGLVLAGACDRDRLGRGLGGRDARPPGQCRYGRDDVRNQRRYKASRIGARSDG